MYSRLLLLSLGWRTKDPYERAVRRALHEYYFTLFGSALLVFGMCYILGCLILRDPWDAGYFLLLPLTMRTRAFIRHLQFAFPYVMAFFLMFMIFLVVTHGDVELSLLAVIAAWILSLILFSSYVKKHSKQALFGRDAHLFTECPMLSKYVEEMSIPKKIKPVTVYLCDNPSWNARAHTYGRIKCISVNARVYDELTGYAMLGVLGHELGHFITPLGHKAFDLLYRYVFRFGDVCTCFLENAALQRKRKLTVQLEMFESDQEMESINFEYVWLLRLARVSSWISSFHASRKRELVADACSALILRDSAPLATALGTYLREWSNVYISSSHPDNKSRIERLKNIGKA